MKKIKKIVDLSWEFTADTPIYPGDPRSYPDTAEENLVFPGEDDICKEDPGHFLLNTTLPQLPF